MHKTNSPEELHEIDYKIGTDGIAHVWIRRNQTQLPDLEEDGISGFLADEVYFRVHAADISPEEIEEDSDFFFEQMSDKEDGDFADHLEKERFRKAKHDELSDACEAAIYAGIDVNVSGIDEHFSLTQHDQLNLLAKQAQLASGSDKLEYHEDGHPCRHYTGLEMQGILDSCLYYISFMTTYCNSLYTWLNSCSKASEMAEITISSEIPEEYRSEVLEDYIRA